MLTPSPVATTRHRNCRKISIGLLVLLISAVVTAPAFASDAAAAYQSALSSFQAALDSGETPHPDQPSWGVAQHAADAAVAAALQALDAARATGAGGDAVAAAGAARAAHQLSARVYSLTGWYSRAFAAWDAYLGEGGELGREGLAMPNDHTLPSDATLFIRTVFELAFARYQAQDMEAASAYYLALLEVLPGEVEALRWLGRIAFETGEAAVAEGYFRALLETSPEDESAAYFLQLSRERQAVGVLASDAFRQGIAAYEAGSPADAFAAFQLAVVENPGFIEASVWAGRTALELKAPAVAIPYWRTVVRARPDDPGAAWFLEYAVAQVEHGVEAGAAYYEGLADYQAGDLEASAAAFERAISAAPTYVEAWTWAARTWQEAGHFEEAAERWRGVLELDPGDERARWFLQRAEQALLYGAEAGTAYFDGAALYLAGDIEGAKERLAAAVQANSDLAIAWGYLGRIALQEERYEDAADAYQRAFELTGDDDYRFFAEEARRLAQPPPAPLIPPPTVLPPSGAEIAPVEPDDP